MSERDYRVGELEIPRELKPPWWMDDRNVRLAFLGYFLLMAVVPVVCMTFEIAGSHW